VVMQLVSAEGLLGYAILARPFSKRFWTLSPSKDEAPLRAFVQHPPHVCVKAALAPHMNETRFVRWAVKGFNYPCVGMMRCADYLSRATPYEHSRREKTRLSPCP